MSKNRADFPPSTRSFQPLRVFGKKDKRMKAEIKAKLNAGRFGATKAATPVASTVPTTQASIKSEETSTTYVASTTTTMKAPKTTEATTLDMETSSASSKPTTAVTNITVLAEKIPVTPTTPSEESGEIAQDEELSMELPEMAVAEIDEETLSNSLSKDIRRAPAREEFPYFQTEYDALNCIKTRF